MTQTPIDRRSPSLRDPLVLAVLALVLALELWSWSASEGYQLADSVEFMERARSFARGRAMVDSVAIRPFGFSSLLVPFFALADWLGLPDQRPVAWAISLLQMALGLGLVLVAMRIGARLGGRRAGLLAGVIAGASPVFLQYSSQPVSGLAAGICAGLALEAVLETGGFRPGLRSGLWLGGAFLMAFQSLLIAAPLVLLLLLRDGVRDRSLLPAAVRGMLSGLACAIAVQVLLDWASFGTPGASLGNYLAQNVGSVAASFLARVGLRDLAVSLYKLNLELQGREVLVAENPVLRAVQSPWFYLVELPRMLVWPAIAALLLGVARGIARPRWQVALPAIALVLNVVAMSNKGSKDFRLWLPLLPWIAGLCAFGWTWLAPRREGARVLVDLSFAGALVLLGGITLAPSGSRRFAGFWRAMDWTNGRAREIALSRGAGRARVACVYNWAVYLRDAPEVDLVKLPWQLDLWPRYEPGQRAEDLRALESLDFLVAHVPLLRAHAELLDFVAGRFRVAAAIYDQTIDLARFGPILVLERRDGKSGENLLFGSGAEAGSPWTGPPAPVHFVGATADGRPENLELAGWRYARLPPQGLGWISYAWRTPTGLSRDHLLRDRITCPEDTFGWQNDHAPCWGRRPTSGWAPGEVLAEGYLVIPALDPYVPGGAYRPIGTAYRAQGEAPAALWFHIAELLPARTGDDRPLDRPPAGTTSETPDGIRQSGDGFVRVATFALPLPDDAP